jgi:hypothetical protein
MKKNHEKNVKSGTWSKKNKNVSQEKIICKRDSAAGVLFLFLTSTPQLSM